MKNNFISLFKNFSIGDFGDYFSSLMKEVFAGTKRGKEDIEQIYSSSRYEDEYDKFTNDLALKRGKDIIDDDCFTEEELEQYEF